MNTNPLLSPGNAAGDGLDGPPHVAGRYVLRVLGLQGLGAEVPRVEGNGRRANGPALLECLPLAAGRLGYLVRALAEELAEELASLGLLLARRRGRLLRAILALLTVLLVLACLVRIARVFRLIGG